MAYGYRLRVYLWRRNPSTPLQLANTNHAAILLQSAWQVSPSRPSVMTYFTTNPIRNPYPNYTLPASGVMTPLVLSGNVWPGVPPLTNQNITTLRGIFGIDWRQRDLWLSAERGQTVATILNNATAGTSFMNFRQRYHHSIPVCLYLAARAAGRNHSRAVATVDTLKQRRIDRSGVSGGASTQPLPIEIDYQAADFDAKLIALGFS